MKKILTWVGVFVLGAAPLVAGAQEFQPLTGIPVFENVKPSGDLSRFFNQLYVLAVGAAAVIAVAQIMIAGFRWATSGGSHSAIEEARSNIQNSVLGLLLVLSPTIVFGIINPDILSLKIDTGLFTREKVDPYATNPDPTTSPEMQAVINSLRKNQYGEFEGNCQLDFDFLSSNTDRTVQLKYLGKNNEPRGKGCCLLMDGVVNDETKTCDLDSLLSHDRYVIANTARTIVKTGASQRSGTTQDTKAIDAFYWTPGADPLSGITDDVFGSCDWCRLTYNFMDLIAIHGFRDKQSCENHIENMPKLLKQVQAQPVVGLIRVNEDSVGFGLGPAILAQDVVDIENVIGELNVCNKIEFNQR